MRTREMTSETPISTIQDLQTQTIEGLNEISSLMQQASTVLGSPSSKEQIAYAIDTVKNLELRMAIVAPMKAGKSTIVNALIGEDLLPSRNTAMTTLPTEIVFSELSEPVLKLSLQIRTVFQSIFFTLQEKIEELGFEQIQPKIATYPHLVRLTQKIQEKKSGSIPEIVNGTRKIINNLGALNDLIRLCNLIAPQNNPLKLLTDIPRLYTSSWQLKTLFESVSLPGNLVIVDTPGPNEAGEHLKLTRIVTQQLNRSSLILLILDFTQLRTEAAEKVKQEVQRVIKLRGIDNLYVLVNKIDQRRQGDLSKEQVQQFVKAEFGINQSDRVFEVSARWAASAAKFIHELQQYPERSLAEMKTAIALAPEVWGMEWEEELEQSNQEELAQKAHKLWQRSGFPQFLEGAIRAILGDVAPRCIISALNIARNSLLELQEEIQLRNQAIAVDEQKLNTELKAIELDLNNLKLCRDRLPELEPIKNQLYERINTIFVSLHQETKFDLETYFVQEDYQDEYLVEDEEKPQSFQDWIAQKAKNSLNLANNKTIEFKSLTEAEEFASLAVEYARLKADSLLEKLQEEIEGEIERSHQEITQYLQAQTQPIVERAYQRLNKTFQLKLSLPTIPLESSFDYDKPQVEHQIKAIDQGYEEKIVEKRSWWYWFWLRPVKETIRIKRPTRKEDYYTVSLEEIVTQVNTVTEQNLTNLQDDIIQYLDKSFREQIATFFDELDRYLRQYSNNLEQAQKDQKLSSDQKETLLAQLNHIASEVTKQLQKADRQLSAVNR